MRAFRELAGVPLGTIILGLVPRSYQHQAAGRGSLEVADPRHMPEVKGERDEAGDKGPALPVDLRRPDVARELQEHDPDEDYN
jgi:hypothetical protein